MALQKSLHSIAITANSITSLSHGHTSATHPAPLFLDADYQLPPSPPIRDVLLALQLKPTIVKTLSAVYEHAASQLKTASEANLKRAIDACLKVNSQFGMFTYDSRSICEAVTDLYMRTLRDMAMQLVSSCRRHMQKSYPSISPTLTPRALRHPRPGRDPISMFIKELQSARSRVVLPQSKSSRTLTSLSTSQRLLEIDSPARKRDVANVPIYALPVAIRREGDLHDDAVFTEPTMKTRPFYAFPARYTHPEMQVRRDLPCSSKDFFPDMHGGTGQTQGRCPGVQHPMNQLLFKFDNLLLGKQQATRIEECVRRTTDQSHSSLSKIKVEEDFDHLVKTNVPHCSPKPNRPVQLSALPFSSSCLAVSDSTIPVTPVRRYAHMPKRLTTSHCSSVSGLTDCHPLHISLSTLAATPSGASSSNVPQDSVSLIVPTSLSVSTSGHRRRKVAALPRRRPTSHPLPRPNAPSCSSSSSSPVTEPSSCTISRTPSRTPSLVSLKSSRSDSPTLSQIDLDTPPPSPTSYDHHLYAPTDSKYTIPTVNFASLYGGAPNETHGTKAIEPFPLAEKSLFTTRRRGGRELSFL